MNSVMYASIPNIFHKAHAIQSRSYVIRSLQNKDPGITSSSILSALLFYSEKHSWHPLASQVANLFHLVNTVFPLEELPHVAATMSKKDLERILHVQSERTTATKFNKCLSN